MSKSKPRWFKGIYAGKLEMDDTCVVLTDCGAITVRSVRRLPAEEQFEPQYLEAAAGLPWAPKTGVRKLKAVTSEPVVVTLPVPSGKPSSDAGSADYEPSDLEGPGSQEDVASSNTPPGSPVEEAPPPQPEPQTKPATRLRLVSTAETEQEKAELDLAVRDALAAADEDMAGSPVCLATPVGGTVTPRVAPAAAPPSGEAPPSSPFRGAGTVALDRPQAFPSGLNSPDGA